MTSPHQDIAALDYDALAAEAQELRTRLQRFRVSLARHFVAKTEVVDLMTLCAVAQEPLLLVGPPGTAKSALVVKFRDALGIPDEAYFEYMLTRFTEPSEVMGPIDIERLRAGAYIRRVEGRLPSAELAFLDEIFKSNSAILNSLLTLINERKYYQDGRPLPVPLRVLFAATNDVPDQAELAALRDRFCLKVACRSVADDHFEALIDAGLEDSTSRDLGLRPWAEGHATLADLYKAHRYLALQMAQTEYDADGEPRRDRDRYFPGELLRELRRLLQTLKIEHRIFVSDRKIVKLYRLLRTRAWLHRGGTVEREDLVLLSYLGDSLAEIDLLAERVPRLLGLA